MKNKNNLLTCIILTYNEEKQIHRCISSLLPLEARIIIVDSISTDQTTQIAESLGAEVYSNPFTNHATQINWALENCQIDSSWVFRLDADEYIDKDLQGKLIKTLAEESENTSGILLKRKVVFMGQWIKYGGYYPIWILRIWKPDKAVVVQRWMDEYVQVNAGETIEYQEDFIEENLNNLSWWTIKHNNYANREVADFIRWKYFSVEQSKSKDRSSNQLKNQWAKWNLYYKLPLLLRPFLYFFYRYFFKLGFLDGKRGLIWHLLQGFWYRFLVDAKYLQLYHLSKKNKESIAITVEKEFGIKL